jgi:hypothetical protein
MWLKACTSIVCELLLDLRWNSDRGSNGHSERLVCRDFVEVRADPVHQGGRVRWSFPSVDLGEERP